MDVMATTHTLDHWCGTSHLRNVWCPLVIIHLRILSLKSTWRKNPHWSLGRLRSPQRNPEGWRTGCDSWPGFSSRTFPRTDARLVRSQRSPVSAETSTNKRRVFFRNHDPHRASGERDKRHLCVRIQSQQLQASFTPHFWLNISGSLQGKRSSS